MNASKNRGSGRYRWILYVILPPLLAVVVGGVLLIHRWGQDAGCKRTLKALYGYILDVDTRLTDPDPDWVSLRGGPLRCNASNAPYVYKPLDSPAKTGGETDAEMQLRLISWCPMPSHFGHRNVLIETGAALPVPESDFQKMAANGYVTTWPELTAAVTRTSSFFK